MEAPDLIYGISAAVSVIEIILPNVTKICKSFINNFGFAVTLKV